MLSEHNGTFGGVNDWHVLGGLKWGYGFADIFHALLDGFKAFVHVHDCIIDLCRRFRVHSLCLWLVSKFLYLYAGTCASAMRGFTPQQDDEPNMRVWTSETA